VTATISMEVPRRAQKEDPTKLDHHHRRSIQVDGPLCHLKHSHTPVSMSLSPIPTVQIIKSIQIIWIIMIPGIIIIEKERDCHRRLRTSAAQRRKRQDKSHELSGSGCGPVESRIQAPCAHLGMWSSSPPRPSFYWLCCCPYTLGYEATRTQGDER
jgi:hypothetical protein